MGSRLGRVFISCRHTLIVALALLCLCGAARAASPDFDVAAPAAILIDATTGQVLFSKKADAERAPASLAKLMTLYLALDAVASGQAKLGDMVPVSSHAWEMGGSQLYLAEGSKYSLDKMLQAVAIASANDAAMAVAEYVSGTEPAFDTLMNQTAKDLGLAHTYYSNPTGLPPDTGEKPDITSARDVAVLARDLITKYPEVLAWTSQRELVFSESNPRIVRTNTDTLIGNYPGLDGLKTGSTDAAGWCLAATAKRSSVRLISVILGADSDNARTDETRRLLDYGFNRFAPADVVAAGQVAGHITLQDASPETFDVTAPATLHVLLPKGQNNDLLLRVVPGSSLKLPIKKGERVGVVEAVLDGQTLVSTPVVAARDVQQAGIAVRLLRRIQGWISRLIGRI